MTSEPSIGHGEAYLRGIFEANPIPTFIVDEDLHILELNHAAADLLGPDATLAFNRKAGEALKCIHSFEGGCGKSPHCKDCAIRNTVGESLRGPAIRRKPFSITLREAAGDKRLDMTVTASRLPERRSLLILEDRTEILALRQLLPVCSYCKKVRSDDDYWQSLEGYMDSHLGFKVSHGICPSCMEKELKAAGIDLPQGTDAKPAVSKAEALPRVELAPAERHNFEVSGRRSPRNCCAGSSPNPVISCRCAGGDVDSPSSVARPHVPQETEHQHAQNGAPENRP